MGGGKGRGRHGNASTDDKRKVIRGMKLGELDMIFLTWPSRYQRYPRTV